MATINEWLQHRTFKRFFVLGVIFLLLYLSKSILNLILITFIMTYLMSRLSGAITRQLNRFIKISESIIIIILYATFLTVLITGLIRYFPKLIMQMNELVQIIIHFYSKPFEPTDNIVIDYITESIRKVDFASYIDQGFNFLVRTVTDLSKWSFNFFIAVILSLFFLLERNRVYSFTAKFKTSKIAMFYNEIEYYGKKFTQSFGKVIEVQFLIALINSFASVLLLWIMGFPSLLGLGIMIFLLGLIPVMGVLISLIPLCAIAFKIGGIVKIVYVLIMIAVLHAVEAYLLNPKLMSAKTQLPIFYTFVVLIYFEHYFHIWGLILGIPIFIFLLDILSVPVVSNDPPLKKSKHRRDDNKST